MCRKINKRKGNVKFHSFQQFYLFLYSSFHLGPHKCHTYERVLIKSAVILALKWGVLHSCLSFCTYVYTFYCTSKTYIFYYQTPIPLILKLCSSRFQRILLNACDMYVDWEYEDWKQKYFFLISWSKWKINAHMTPKDKCKYFDQKILLYLFTKIG